MVGDVLGAVGIARPAQGRDAEPLQRLHALGEEGLAAQHLRALCAEAEGLVERHVVRLVEIAGAHGGFRAVDVDDDHAAVPDGHDVGLRLLAPEHGPLFGGDLAGATDRERPARLLPGLRRAVEDAEQRRRDLGPGIRLVEKGLDGEQGRFLLQREPAEPGALLGVQLDGGRAARALAGVGRDAARSEALATLPAAVLGDAHLRHGAGSGRAVSFGTKGIDAGDKGELLVGGHGRGAERRKR